MGHAFSSSLRENIFRDRDIKIYKHINKTTGKLQGKLGQKTYPTFIGKHSHKKGPSIVRYCPLLSSNTCMAPSYESSQVTMSFSLLQTVAKPVDRISQFLGTFG